MKLFTFFLFFFRGERAVEGGQGGDFCFCVCMFWFWEEEEGGGMSNSPAVSFKFVSKEWVAP